MEPCGGIGGTPLAQQISPVIPARALSQASPLTSVYIIRPLAHYHAYRGHANFVMLGLTFVATFIDEVSTPG
uniref:MFS transporter n=1 Tax=Ascaris lumbricoides TaxID=6252 RepID=A0A0M3HXN7_ASCLU